MPNWVSHRLIIAIAIVMVVSNVSEIPRGGVKFISQNDGVPR